MPDPGLPEPAEPRVLVIVGTDHHPFNRLIRWINDWLAAHPAQVPGFFVQSGAASVRPICPGVDYLDAEQLDAALGEADVIVCHGGPGTIADAWDRGLLPIAVPRVPELGEIVDAHQVFFCSKLADSGRVRMAQRPAEFARLLTEATRDRAGFQAGVRGSDVEAAVARFGELVEDLVSRPPRRLTLTHRSRQPRRPEHGTDATSGAGNPPPRPFRAATAQQAGRADVRTGFDQEGK